MRRPWLLAPALLALALAPACSGDDDDDPPASGGAAGRAGAGGGPAGAGAGGQGGAAGANAGGGGAGGGGGATSGPNLAAFEALVAALPSLPATEREQRVGAFLRDVAYAGGWPLREGNRVAFAYRDPDDGPEAPSVVGAFNGWQPGAAPMARAAEGYGFYYAVLALETPAADQRLYKFARGGDYFADPAARRFAFDENGQHSLLAENPARSHFERWPDFDPGTPALAARPVYVYVPPGYDAAGAALPVLYMHDGQNLFPGGGPFGTWALRDVFDAEIAAGRARPALVVGVANTDARFLEYTHVPDAIGGPGPVGGGAAAYVEFLAGAVRPFVEAHYRALAGPPNTGVLGSSLGGLVSLYAARRRPDVFGFAGSMSGTFGWGSIGAGVHNDTMMELYDAKVPVRIYLDSGGGDGNDDGDLDDCVDADADGVRDDVPAAGDNFCENLDMRDALLARGWQLGVDLTYAFAPGAQHDEAAWRARLPAVLSGWFPGPPAP